MKSKFANITKNEIELYILPFILKNKRGFAPKVDLADVMQCIVYKLKTGIQRKYLLILMELINSSRGSWFTVITANGAIAMFFTG